MAEFGKRRKIRTPLADVISELVGGQLNAADAVRRFDGKKGSHRARRSRTNTLEPMMDKLDDPRREPLAAAGKQYIARDHVSALIQLALALGSARTLGWYNAWVYAAVILSVKLGSAMVLVRINPAVLNARGTKREMSRQERLFFAVYLPATMAIPVVAGLEVGAPGWTHASLVELLVGIALVLVGAGLIIWALAHNAFFEPTVRLQTDRHQRVCTSGPYRLVRHPGYLGAIVATAGIPLVLGSRWAFVPFAIVTVAFVMRTRLEDRMLSAKLDGYADYARRTRFRLVPGLW